MRLYTLQMGKWRLAQAKGFALIDTTVRSGELAFAPTWEMVKASKAGTLSPEAYTEQYRALMLTSVRTHAKLWREISALDDVALLCYCPAGTFCHRHLLAGYFEEYCIATHRPITLMGELTHETA